METEKREIRSTAPLKETLERLVSNLHKLRNSKVQSKMKDGMCLTVQETSRKSTLFCIEKSIGGEKDEYSFPHKAKIYEIRKRRGGTQIKRFDGILFEGTYAQYIRDHSIEENKKLLENRENEVSPDNEEIENIIKEFFIEDV